MSSEHRYAGGLQERRGENAELVKSIPKGNKLQPLEKDPIKDIGM